MLGFTISIRKDAMLEDGNSIILDRDLVLTVQPNLQLTNMINCSPTDRSVQAERTFHGTVEAKTNRLFSSIHRPAALTTAHPNPRPFASGAVSMPANLPNMVIFSTNHCP